MRLIECLMVIIHSPVCWQWLDVGAAEAEVVAEEGVEAGEAHGDNRWASRVLSRIPLFVYIFFFWSVFLGGGALKSFDCALVALLTFFLMVQNLYIKNVEETFFFVELISSKRHLN